MANDSVQVFWQLTGALVMIILLPVAAVKTQPAKYVFTTFSYEQEFNNPSKTYVALLGLLYTQFTINGDLLPVLLGNIRVMLETDDINHGEARCLPIQSHIYIVLAHSRQMTQIALI